MKSLQELKEKAAYDGHRLGPPRPRVDSCIDLSMVVAECYHCDAVLSLNEESGLYYGTLTEARRCLGAEKK